MDAERRLSISFGVTVLILFAEVIGGIVSNSLALLSDAGHVLTDAFALGLSIIAARISRKPSDHRATYGYQRVGLLAAVINGISLLAISAFIFFESYKRFVAPPRIDISLMLVVAAFGLAGNIVMAFIIGRKHEDLNIRSAWLHVLGDTLSSIGVIASGLIIFFTQWTYADPLASVIIGIVILSGGARVVKEAMVIFLEMTPKGFHAEEISKVLCNLPEVMGVHDVHIWSVAHKRVAFTAHVWVQDRKLSEVEGVRKRIESVLKEMGIGHIIIQFECAECAASELYCQIHLKDEEYHENEHRH
ncbi:MAG TPA: cation diffusion facilitator family transporter [Thermodesulfovibrionales bacterium]|nr:cation diffusion facilitator family transporter [Thermodesulfovibrionales bacterium]